MLKKYKENKEKKISIINVTVPYLNYVKINVM